MIEDAGLKFDAYLIYRHDDTLEEFLEYERFMDIKDDDLSEPKYVAEQDVLLVPGDVPFDKIPVHPGLIPPKVETLIGSRRIRIFDPRKTMKGGCVYLREYGHTIGILVEHRAYNNQAGVLIEYDQSVETEIDEGSLSRIFIPLDEVIVPKGKTEPLITDLSKEHIWLYSTVHEAEAAKKRVDIDAEITEARIAKRKLELVNQEIGVRERDLVLKNETSTVEYDNKVRKNDSDSFKIGIQLAGVFLVGAAALFKLRT